MLSSCTCVLAQQSIARVHLGGKDGGANGGDEDAGDEKVGGGAIAFGWLGKGALAVWSGVSGGVGLGW